MSLKLKKAEREQLKQKYDGRCAYCGEPLADRWHVDHLEAVEREFVYKRGKGFVATGKLYRPQNDTLENMMPSCPPCNIDKHSMPLEAWRGKLQRAVDVLTRNNPTYRHAKRFGLVAETGAKVVFYFETVEAELPNQAIAV